MVFQGILMYWTLILCVYKYALIFMDCAAVAQILFICFTHLLFKVF